MMTSLDSLKAIKQNCFSYFFNIGCAQAVERLFLKTWEKFLFTALPTFPPLSAEISLNFFFLMRDRAFSLFSSSPPTAKEGRFLAFSFPWAIPRVYSKLSVPLPPSCHAV